MTAWTKRRKAAKTLPFIEGVPANPLYHLVRVKVFDQHTGRGVNPLTMLYFLRRAAKLAERFSGDSLTTSHPEAHLGERLDTEISQVRGKASKRRFRFMLRTIIDLTAAKESELLDPNGLALNLEGVEVVTNKGSQRALM